jgi:nicotinamide-nucleotide amidase
MDTFQLASVLGEKLKQKQWLLAVAESCTGGGLAQAITSVPGTSGWFERGFVTYSNLAKQEMLGVATKTLNKYGAVSSEVAQEMAEGVLHHSSADIGIAITGVAGPSGGSKEKPVGLVWFGFAGENFTTITKKQNFSGSRAEVREQAIIFVLKELISIL